MNDFAQYGILGSVIIMLLGGLKILWDKLNKKDEEYAKERKEDRERHLDEWKKVADTYANDSKNMGMILKEFELLLKQKIK